MQAWQEHGFSVDWAKEAGLDVRGLRFARDVRRQLDSITGPNGSHLLGLLAVQLMLTASQGSCWFDQMYAKWAVSSHAGS